MRGFAVGLITFSLVFPSIAIGYSGSIPNDPLFPYQKYLQQVKVDTAWQYSHGSEDVVVAIIDEGVDFGHPDLQAAAWTNVYEKPDNGIDDDGNGLIDDYEGYNFLTNSSFMKPFGAHGTMIAGIVGATTNNDLGISGINWAVKILPIITGTDAGMNDEANIQGIRYAADMGADVINMSFGGPGWNEELNRKYLEAIDYAFSKGAIVVISAGNGFAASGLGKNLNILGNAPVCADHADKVLGVTSVDGNNQKSSWADYGSDCVDLAAPGELIVSTSIPHFNPSASEYDVGDGTSFSAPIVAGIAALVKAKNPTLKNSEIIKILKSTATNIDSLNGRFAGQIGTGLVNAEAALAEASGLSAGFVRTADTSTTLNPALLINLPDLSPPSSISADKDLTAALQPAGCFAGTLIRGSSPAVYYCGDDGKRYVFPNARTYNSWYTSFDGVTQISDGQLATISLGGNVTYRPGIRMIKIQTDTKVYAVAKNGTLRWISSEAAARSLYGDNWSQYVDDVPDAFFTNYRIGEPISP
jgi:subtilisin family serine protease